MKKVSDEKKVLKAKLWLEKKLMMKYKKVFLILKTSFKFSIEKSVLEGGKGKIFLVTC